MKKRYFVIIMMTMLIVPFTGFTQNLVVNGGLEQWDDPLTPTGWDLMENITRESVNVNNGDFAAGQLSVESGSQKFRQDVEGIVGGQQYTISYYFLDNVDNAKTRIWSYWLDASGGYLDDDGDVLRPDEYSTNSADWQHYNQELTAPSAAAQFRLEVRVYHQDNNVDGHVYYDDFSIEGMTTNYPEPTNYPTAFEAAAAALSINITWVDATGDQLPGAYLLLGQKGTSGSFTTPVDGTPVLDDMDWADGNVAVNVSYGEEMYAFSGLESGESYEFTIFPYTNAGANIDYKTDGDPPYATAEVSSVTVINSEDFNDGTLGTWTEYNVEGPQIWEPYEFSGDQFVRCSGYDNGAIVNEDWLLSPAMDLSAYQTVTFTFSNATSFSGPHVQLFFSQDYDGTSDPNGFTWLELTDQAEWSTSNYNWVESGDVDLSLYVLESCYLAFKYTSTSSEAAIWEVDNLLVIGEAGLGAIENENEQLSFYPNPATDVVHFSNLQAGEIRIVNLTGQVVKQRKTDDKILKLDISELNSGLYLIQFINNEHKVVTGKLMVR